MVGSSTASSAVDGLSMTNVTIPSSRAPNAQSERLRVYL